MLQIDEIKLIEQEMRKIVPIFLREMVDYVPIEKRRYLTDAVNLHSVIKFDNGFGAWCRGNNIYIALQNGRVFKKMSKKEEYGTKPNSILVTEENFIDNDKDYIDYMQYLTDKGLKEIDYCLDVLPHEVMHLVGATGGVLGEGITELRTREICKKYGIRCAPVMHTKETKLARMLEKHIDKMRLNEAAFSDYIDIVLDEGEKVFGPAFKETFIDLCAAYRDYLNDRSYDPIEHYKKYREIDFEPMYKLIQDKETEEAEL